jgi:ribosomal subunit interface protein
VFVLEGLLFCGFFKVSIKITGRHTDIGESLNNFITKGLEDFIEKHSSNFSDVNVIIDLKMKLGKQLPVHVKSSDNDPYKSFSLIIEQLESKLKKYKKRIRDQKRLSQDTFDFDVVSTKKYIIENKQAYESENENPIVIAEMDTEILNLTVSDAVMKLDFAGKDFLLFKNSANGNINVIYKRKDGNIGWFDPALSSNAHK